ncbi:MULTISPECIES: hypothetical protein [Xanthobacter]|uniref:hypothetical protein n=1 Tax=Xanthobacter TaxID=279 RepID=UPI0035AF793C
MLDRDFGTISARGFQRGLGSILGALAELAALLLQLQLDNLLVYLAVLASGIFYFSRLLTDGGPPAELMPVVERLTGIFIGVALMRIASLVLSALHNRQLTPAPTVNQAG